MNIMEVYFWFGALGYTLVVWLFSCVYDDCGLFAWFYVCLIDCLMFLSFIWLVTYMFVWLYCYLSLVSLYRSIHSPWLFEYSFVCLFDCMIVTLWNQGSTKLFGWLFACMFVWMYDLILLKLGPLFLVCLNIYLFVCLIVWSSTFKTGLLYFVCLIIIYWYVWFYDLKGKVSKLGLHYLVC